MTSNIIERYLTLLVMVCVALVTALCLFYAAERVNTVMLDEPFDHAIFARAGHNFWQTGQFYPRVDEPYPTFLPGAAVFKFPPVYQLYVAPWVKQGITVQYYHASYLTCLVLYILSVMLLCRHILISLQPTSRCFTVCFTGITVSTACLLEPFYSCLTLLAGEIPIFFCCVMALFFAKTRPLLAGVMIAIAATAKIYPVFMLLYVAALHSNKQRMYFFSGFIAGSSALLLLTLYFFGTPELIYYLTTVFPVLMKEHPMGISENINLIFFLFPDGITHFFAENAFIFIRLTTIALLGYITASSLKKKPRNTLDNTLLYSLLITSMVICLANYWLQYEVLLLAPSLVILGTTLRYKRYVLAIFSSVILLILISSTELADSLFNAHVNEPLAKIIEKIEIYGNFITRWKISPTAVLVAHLALIKPLAPYGLFIVTGALLMRHGLQVNAQNNTRQQSAANADQKRFAGIIPVQHDINHTHQRDKQITEPPENTLPKRQIHQHNRIPNSN